MLCVLLKVIPTTHTTSIQDSERGESFFEDHTVQVIQKSFCLAIAVCCARSLVFYQFWTAKYNAKNKQSSKNKKKKKKKKKPSGDIEYRSCTSR